MLSKFLKTLLLTDPSDDLATLSRERGKIINGSCEWILAQENYLTWLQETGLQRLRITRRPGIRKTTIFRFIYKSLKSTAEPKTLLCYYLFDYRHADRRGSTAVLRSLIFQILTQQPFLFGLIRKDFELQDDRYTENFHLMWRNLCSLLQAKGVQVVYILLDGLDKCDKKSRADLLREFSSLEDTLGHTAALTIKLLLTTRPADDIEEHLTHWPRLEVDSEKISADLSRYIDEQVDVLARTKGYPSELHADVKSTINEQANGTFLWASLVLKDLAKARAHEVRRKLANIPAGLDEVFERILCEIDADHTDAAIFVLQWVAVARRPMAARELATAFRIHTRAWDLQHLPSPSRIEELADIYKDCESLLYVDPAKSTINFLHQSVKDFIVGEAIKANPTIGKFGVSIAEANSLALNICCTFLECQEMEEGRRVLVRQGLHLRETCSNWNQAGLLLSEVFLAYVGPNWLHHARACSDSILLNDVELFQRLTKLPTIRDMWLLSSVSDDNIPTTKMLLEHGADTGVMSVDGSTLLHMAVGRHNLNMVTLFLDQHFNPDKRDSDGLTALYFAASEGDWSMVRLLKKYGAQNININSRICQSVPSPCSQRPTDDELFQQDGRPNISFLQSLLSREGRLEERQAIAIIESATALFTHEPNLLPALKAPINVCSQIFGQYYDLLKLFEVGGAPDENQYLFLGNIVDKGDFGIECVMHLCALKLHFPTSMLLLRGPHESERLTEHFTFKSEVIHKYSEDLYQVCLTLFRSLPLAAVVDGKFLCVHGGISPEWHFLDDVNEVKLLLLLELSLQRFLTQKD